MRSSPEIARSDENEVVTEAGNEKVSPRLDDDKHSKEVKIIMHSVVLVTHDVNVLCSCKNIYWFFKVCI